MYAMAEDGLLFDIFARVHERFKTPTWGIIIAGLLTGILSAIFDVNQLVNMISIGTVMLNS
jgi:solute carrier family 7 (cationic amino acid transporter), member 3